MYTPYKVPVSVKGIVFEDNAVWLRKNERDEWELPGGKMEEGEQPPETAVRELLEELGFRVRSTGIVDAYLYTIKTTTDESRGVLVVSYLCELESKVGGFEVLGEAGPAYFQKFRMDELDHLKMPEFYKVAINKAFQTKRSGL